MGGLCYFLKLDKERKALEEAEKENSGTEVEYDDGKAKKNKKEEEILLPDDYKEDDMKHDAKEDKFKTLGEGFEVVKAMFDTIDEDKSGEISLQEFEQSFSDICRDPDIVKEK